MCCPQRVGRVNTALPLSFFLAPSCAFGGWHRLQRSRPTQVGFGDNQSQTCRAACSRKVSEYPWRRRISKHWHSAQARPTGEALASVEVAVSE
jgi:hypothetical protein